jgi:glycerol-3-phosphate dehydrogenase
MYDYMGGRRLLPPTKTLDLTRDEAGKPLKPGYRLAFEYSDCWVNDSRFVVLNALDAAERGAKVHVRTRVTSARREDGGWTVELDGEGGRQTVRAKLLVNAAGPWVDEVINGVMGRNGRRNVRLVQGSHIVVRKLYEHDRCYFFQNSDGRIFFAIPYEEDFTLIGTTDRDFDGDPRDVRITEEETDYLLRGASEYFAKPVTRDEIVWSYSGVRPLFDDGASAAQEATRDYVLKVDGDSASGAVVNVFGGKLTTSRRLAESVLEKIEEVLGKKGPAWTKTGTLPGGDFGVKSFDAEVRRLGLDYPGFEAPFLRRLMRLYGTRARFILGEARSVADLGQHFGADLYAAEVVYLVEQEWARTAEDVLWRRTKQGLRVGGEDVARLEGFIRARK